jgi:hypothetical protein
MGDRWLSTDRWIGRLLASDRGSARHELPEIDRAALEAALAADRTLAAAQELGSERWATYLARVPDRLRDDPVAGVRSAARLVRAAFGPKDSIRDSLPEAVTEPLLKSVDLVLKAIARYEAHR